MRGAKVKFPQKSNRKALVKTLDSYFSLFIRDRDKRCVLCGKRENLQCGHLLTRTAYSTRWDEENCFCQCSGCNMSHEHHPQVFINWYIGKFGIAKWEQLCARHARINKISNYDLQKKIILYRIKLDGSVKA